MKEKFDSKTEAINFIRSRIGIAFTNAEKKGKIRGLNSLLDFREEMEEQFINFIEEYFDKYDQLIQQQQGLLDIANKLNDQAKITKLIKDNLRTAHN